jgi:hypothetical protein
MRVEQSDGSRCPHAAEPRVPKCYIHPYLGKDVQVHLIPPARHSMGRRASACTPAGRSQVPRFRWFPRSLWTGAREEVRRLPWPLGMGSWRPPPGLVSCASGARSTGQLEAPAERGRRRPRRQ